MKTDFIDLFYLHIWDDLTPIDEVMRGLEDLVKQGKINYIGINDTRRGLLPKGNTMAELLGWSQFVALQVEIQSAPTWTPERSYSMAGHYNMTVTPWAPLEGGALTGKYHSGDFGRLKETSNRLNEQSVAYNQRSNCNRSRAERKPIACCFKMDDAKRLLLYTYCRCDQTYSIGGESEGHGRFVNR